MWNLKIITLATISSEGKKHWRGYVSGSDANLTRMVILEVVENAQFENIL